ncbi:amidohydrolase family protein [Caenimonas terrae]|uniref:amidohydrolase family protein n=1 Tax=Caenimonas terrae TaxID=696074 RepID=UPI0036721528
MIHIDQASPGTAPLADAPVVDAHAHAFTLDMPLSPTAWHAPPAAAPIEQYLAALDANGVTFGVLAGATLFGTYNDYAIEACRRHRRLRTTVILEPDTSQREMRAMAADGVIGVRLQWRHVREVPDLKSGAYRVFLRRIADLGWQVHLHDDSDRLPPYLDALEAAGVTVVVEHFGRPNPDTGGTACPGFQRVLRSVETGRTWVKLASAFRLASAQLARDAAAELLRHAGPERLVWGSDWPFAAFESSIGYRQTLDTLQDLVPDPAARRRITCETPLKLFFA